MFEISRSAITVFGLAIHWYGILIAAGVLGAALLALRRERLLGLERDTALNLALVCVPAGILCARLYYVLFSWDYFAAHPGEIFNLRNGGLAIYGAVIGGGLAALVYAKLKKVSIGSIADLIVPGLALGQAIGRWGNFLNQEAYGAAVENPALHIFPLSVYIEGSGWHYAAFFYESLWCALICIFLLLAEKKGWLKKRGDGFLCYVFLYALERSVVEGLRADSLYLGAFRISQLLSFAALLAVMLLLCLRIRGKRRTASWIRMAGILFCFGLSLVRGVDALTPAWALLTAVNAFMEYKRISQTNDEM